MKQAVFKLSITLDAKPDYAGSAIARLLMDVAVFINAESLEDLAAVSGSELSQILSRKDDQPCGSWSLEEVEPDDVIP